MELVVGADVGGTSTRVAVADLSGEIHALAAGGPGNPVTVGPAASTREIRSVLEQAISRVPGGGAPGRVSAVVIGLAGGSAVSGDPAFLAAAVPATLDRVALVVSDLTVAFCSATPAAGGCVLVAGTGAVAGRVAGTRLVEQRDGWGWLLGDQGSGFWIGREAVRSTLAALQRGRRLSPLEDDVLALSGTDDYPGLLDACYRARPGWLAQFSPLVSRRADHDPSAAAIVDAAAAALCELLLSLRPDGNEPIVLAGSVVAPATPVGRLVRAALGGDSTAEQPRRPVLSAASGVVGALWLGLGPRAGDAAATHARLTASLQKWA